MYDIAVIVIMIVIGIAFIAACTHADKFIDKDDDKFNHRKM